VILRCASSSAKRFSKSLLNAKLQEETCAIAAQHREVKRYPRDPSLLSCARNAERELCRIIRHLGSGIVSDVKLLAAWSQRSTLHADHVRADTGAAVGMRASAGAFTKFAYVDWLDVREHFLQFRCANGIHPAGKYHGYAHLSNRVRFKSPFDQGIEGCHIKNLITRSSFDLD